MPQIANLVHQSSASTGTGALTLTAQSGRQNFYAAFGTGGSDVFFYFISHRTAAEWEVGTGHLSDAATLVRDTVIASSNANTAVNFSTGTKDVVNDIPSSYQAQLTTLSADLSAKASLSSVNAYTAQQYAPFATLTSASGAIAWNLDTAQNASYTATENSVVAAPTNIRNGGTYIFAFTQHATSAKTLGWNSAFKWVGGVVPVATTTLNATDIYSFIAKGGNLHGVQQKDSK